MDILTISLETERCWLRLKFASNMKEGTTSTVRWLSGDWPGCHPASGRRCHPLSPKSMRWPPRHTICQWAATRVRSQERTLRWASRPRSSPTCSMYYLLILEVWGVSGQDHIGFDLRACRRWSAGWAGNWMDVDGSQRRECEQILLLSTAWIATCIGSQEDPLAFCSASPTSSQSSWSSWSCSYSPFYSANS